MGRYTKIHHDSLIEPTPDRNSNRLRVHEDEQGEVTINFRNLKIVLHTREEVEEWKSGFRTAYENLGDWFKDDI